MHFFNDILFIPVLILLTFKLMNLTPFTYPVPEISGNRINAYDATCVSLFNQMSF